LFASSADVFVGRMVLVESSWLTILAIVAFNSSTEAHPARPKLAAKIIEISALRAQARIQCLVDPSHNGVAFDQSPVNETLPEVALRPA
jgi:hypothetical protein